MRDSTLQRARAYAKAAGRYPRTDKIPNHHGPSITADLATLQCCGETAAAGRIQRFRETLNDLSIIARTNPVHREWLAATLAPAVAACATPDDGEAVMEMAEAYANADARTQPALVRWLAHRTEATWSALRAALRLERARNAELEGLVEARRVQVGTQSW